MNKVLLAIFLFTISTTTQGQNKIPTYKKLVCGTWKTSDKQQQLKFTKAGICIAQFGTSAPDTSTYKVNIDPESGDYQITTKSIHATKYFGHYMIRTLTALKLDIWIMGVDQQGTGVYLKVPDTKK